MNPFATRQAQPMGAGSSCRLKLKRRYRGGIKQLARE